MAGKAWRQHGALALGVFFALCVLVAVVASCTPTITANPGPAEGRASQTVDSTGATVSATDGTTLLIPPGALATPVTITIDLAPDAPLPPGTTAVSTPHVFGPDFTTFLAETCLTLTFEPEQLPPGTTEKDVVLYAASLQNPTYYEALQTYGVDATHVMARTSGLALTVVAVYGGAQEIASDADIPWCDAGPEAGGADESGGGSADGEAAAESGGD